MVILKTKSQVRNFVKRMSKEHSYYHYEGCGCCSSVTSVNFDRRTNKVLILNWHTHQGFMKSSCKVIAIYNKVRS
jgi:hypothetical protein